MLFTLCVFFFKQKTAYEMRISDWSSDVCSSDLPDMPARLDPLRILIEQRHAAGIGTDQSQQQADRGGLAGTVGAEQRQQFAAKQLQIHTIQRGERAIALDGAVERGDRVVGMRHGKSSSATHADRKSTRLNSSH